MTKVAEQPTEKQVSHTPGPWKAVFPNRGVTEMSSIYAPVAVGEEPWRVAYVLREDNPNQRKVDDANAHLIAAAPELLAAANFALSYVVSRGDLREGTEAMQLQKSLRAALAKAKGRS